MSKLRLFLRSLFRKLWFIALLYAVLALLTNVTAILIGPLLPEGLGEKLGAGAVETVLTILTSSMLTVVTFSLGIMVSALSSAAAAVTPRAIELLKADGTTHRVLAVFLGSFLFGLIGIIALNAGVLTDNDRLVLFVVTILVILIVVIAILRWIAHLTVFGLMTDSIDKVETAAQSALSARMKSPYLGGHGHPGPAPAGATPVYAKTIGYIRFLHMEVLQDCATAMGCQIYLAALPGTFVHPGMVLAHLEGTIPTLTDDLQKAFTIGDTRSFDQDPRFGLSVLAEIAERALSPAVNDPGTAIDVLGRAVRLLACTAETPTHKLEFPRIWVPPLMLDNMMEDIFPPIARDGAAIFGVQIRLQKALLALAQIAPARFGKLALLQAERAMQRSRNAMMEHERAALNDVMDQIAATANPHRPHPI